MRNQNSQELAITHYQLAVNNKGVIKTDLVSGYPCLGYPEILEKL